MDCIIKGRNAQRLRGGEALIKALARVGTCTFSETAVKPAQSASGVAQDFEVFVPLAGLIDVAKERERLAKEADALRKSIGNIAAKLSDPGFTAKAPPQVIAKENGRLAEYRDKLAKFEAQATALQ